MSQHSPCDWKVSSLCLLRKPDLKIYFIKKGLKVPHKTNKGSLLLFLWAAIPKPHCSTPVLNFYPKLLTMHLFHLFLHQHCHPITTAREEPHPVSGLIFLFFSEGGKHPSCFQSYAQCNDPHANTCRSWLDKIGQIQPCH